MSMKHCFRCGLCRRVRAQDVAARFGARSSPYLLKSGGLALVTALLTSCMAAMYGTAAKLETISVGMTKEEAISRLGQPQSVATDGQLEYLNYEWVDGVFGYPNLPKDYFVAVRNDHVVGYGKKGDFGTTRNPTLEVNVGRGSNNQGVDVQSYPNDKLSQLKRLFDLKQAGAISEGEYQQQKSELLHD